MDLSLLSLRYLNTGVQNNIYQRWVIKISQFHIRVFSIYRFYRLRRSSCVYVIIIVICKYTFHVMFVVIAYGKKSGVSKIVRVHFKSTNSFLMSSRRNVTTYGDKIKIRKILRLTVANHRGRKKRFLLRRYFITNRLVAIEFCRSFEVLNTFFTL